jgi:hypothetical protein
MYSLFLEEEGYSPSFKHYILGGCIVPFENVRKINTKITDLKKFLYSSAYIDLIQIANPDKKTIVIDKNVKYEIENYRLKDILNEIFKAVNNNELFFLSSIVEKEKWYEKNFYPDDMYYIAYYSIIKRFNDFLDKYNLPGNMIIRDDNYHLKTNLETAHHSVVENDDFKKINNIIDSFHFLYSYNTNLIQLAYLFVKSCLNLLENNVDICFKKFLPFIYAKDNNIKDIGIEVIPSYYYKKTKLNDYIIIV